jgi:thiol-disulfide isomerase/thioredoxin
MLSDTITYDEACSLVKDVKNGKSRKVFCMMIVTENCQFCEDMMDNVMGKVEEEFIDDVEFMKMDIDKEESDNCIFPVIETPTFLFYVKGGKPFPALRKGTAPVEDVIKDINNIISVNKDLNGAYT